MKSDFLACCRWVRATNEFLGVLHSSHYMHEQKKVEYMLLYILNKLIDKGLLSFCPILSWCTKWNISSARNRCFSLLMAMLVQVSTPNTLLDSSIDQGPYINVTEDGMVAALNDEPTTYNQKKYM